MASPKPSIRVAVFCHGVNQNEHGHDILVGLVDRIAFEADSSGQTRARGTLRLFIVINALGLIGPHVLRAYFEDPGGRRSPGFAEQFFDLPATTSADGPSDLRVNEPFEIDLFPLVPGEHRLWIELDGEMLGYTPLTIDIQADLPIETASPKPTPVGPFH